VKVTINTNITIDKVPTDIRLCPWHDICIDVSLKIILFAKYNK
jgi:hypothetical protein